MRLREVNSLPSRLPANDDTTQMTLLLSVNDLHKIVLGSQTPRRHFVPGDILEFSRDRGLNSNELYKITKSKVTP